MNDTIDRCQMLTYMKTIWDDYYLVEGQHLWNYENSQQLDEIACTSYSTFLAFVWIVLKLFLSLLNTICSLMRIDVVDFHSETALR